MSLQSRLASLLSSIGADIKLLRESRFNASIADQSGFANYTFLTGSSIRLPTGLKAGSCYRCRFEVTKTAAGVSPPVIGVFVANGLFSVTSPVASLSFPVQTAIADYGVFEVDVIFRNVGTSAVLRAMGQLWHHSSTGGLTTAGIYSNVLATSSTFNSTTSGFYIYLGVLAGGSAAWTVTMVEAELMNLSA